MSQYDGVTGRFDAHLTTANSALLILDGTFSGSTTACPVLDPLATQSCPPACSSITYAVSLSQLQLSVASVNINTTELQARYLDAIDLASRVSPADMNFYVGQLLQIDEMVVVLQSELNLGIVDPQTSTFQRLYEAVNGFATDMQKDVNGFSKLLLVYQMVYNHMLSFFVKSFDGRLSDFIVVLAKLSLYAIEVSPNVFLLESKTKAEVRNFVDAYNGFEQNLTAILNNLNVTFTLDTITDTNVGGVSCSQATGNFNSSVYNLFSTGNDSLIEQSATDQLLGNATAFINCVKQYGSFLATARAWVDRVTLNVTASPPNVIRNLPQLVIMWPTTALFAANQMSKVDLAANISDAFVTGQTSLATIQSAVQSAGDSFNATAQSSLTSISASIQQLVAYTSILSQFNPNDDKITTFARNLNVWMNPQPQISSSQVGVNNRLRCL